MTPWPNGIYGRTYWLPALRPWGEGADEGLLEELLRKDSEKKIKAVCVVHNETTTGGV
jgi:alanine-glyoxylate transaminase/serine-glyoxylate transaminase/serine-pyruvate transaminase